LDNSALGPPPAATAEAGVVACCLQDPSAFTKVDAQCVPLLAAFDDLRLRAVVREMELLHRDGQGWDVLSLGARLKDNPAFVGTDVNQFLSDAEGKSPSALNLPYYMPDLIEASQRRRVWEIAHRAQAVACDTTQSPKILLEDLDATLRAALGDDALPPIIDASEFVSNILPKPRELVHGVLHRGSKLALGGGSKSFKTWTLLDLALSVSHGAPWLGFEVDPGRVLYVNFEIQDYAWQGRIEAVARAKAIELQAGKIALLNLRGRAANFRTLLPKLVSRAKNEGFVLVILDPIYKLYGQTDENSAGDVAALCNAIEDLTVQTGAAVAFGAHFSKGNQSGKEAIDRISGSGVFARDPDSMLIFTRHEEEGAFGVDCILRNFKPVPQFAVRFQFPLMRRDDSLDPTRLKKTSGRKPEHDPTAILKVLPDGGLGVNDWEGAAREQYGIYGTTFHRLRRTLERQGKVLKSNVNGKWQPIAPKL